MNKVKAIVCSILLMIAIFILLFATMFVRGENVSLYAIVVNCMSGMWIADKVEDFYNWLRNNA